MNELYPSNVLKIPNATPNPKDAAQYMFRNGRVQYNLCGPMAVAFCMQDEAHTSTIDDFLDYWQAKSLPWYKTLFQNGLSRTTGIPDLKQMLDDYDAQYGNITILNDPLVVSDQLVNFQAIIGVNIDYNGTLVGSGIKHWVVLESVVPADAFTAAVTIYNPFTNSKQPYGWKELMTSAGSYKYGLWVKR